MANSREEAMKMLDSGAKEEEKVESKSVKRRKDSLRSSSES